MKTWGNPNLGIRIADEIKRKDDDTEWIVTKIDYPQDCPGKILINVITKYGETLQTIFDPDEWLISGINYGPAFLELQKAFDAIESEHLQFFGDRGCKTCKHWKIGSILPNLEAHGCEVWECKYEPKEKDNDRDIKDRTI